MSSYSQHHLDVFLLLTIVPSNLNGVNHVHLMSLSGWVRFHSWLLTRKENVIHSLQSDSASWGYSFLNSCACYCLKVFPWWRDGYDVEGGKRENSSHPIGESSVAYTQGRRNPIGKIIKWDERINPDDTARCERPIPLRQNQDARGCDKSHSFRRWRAADVGERIVQFHTPPHWFNWLSYQYV